MNINSQILKEIDQIENLLNTIRKVANNGENDLDQNCLSLVEKSLASLDEVSDQILQNQKKRGKKFLSNEEIDSIVANAIKEGHESK